MIRNFVPAGRITFPFIPTLFASCAPKRVPGASVDETALSVWTIRTVPAGTVAAGESCATSPASIASPTRIKVLTFIAGVCRIRDDGEYWTLVLYISRAHVGGDCHGRAVLREHLGGTHAPLLEDGSDSGHADVEQANEVLVHDLDVATGGIW